MGDVYFGRTATHVKIKRRERPGTVSKRAWLRSETRRSVLSLRGFKQTSEKCGVDNQIARESDDLLWFMGDRRWHGDKPVMHFPVCRTL
jgi:hypothetical protein